MFMYNILCRTNDGINFWFLTFQILSIAEEIDEDLFTVPDVEACPTVPPGAAAATNESAALPQQMGADGQGKRRRGRNPVDKEYKRLKR